ncbi:hypothetical protein [Hymenobacter arizonensis]|uniref:hypothetical protein n=1 Tax=Hymenobacter arizonensis TaxID=1227077 RepID=UPI000B85071D|nr:hypothetical protein [Hymenobacter arizonensis]
MKKALLLRVAYTNLTHCLRLLAVFCLTGFFYVLFHEEASIITKIFGGLFAPLLFALSFGLLFWVGFLILTLVLDIALFSLRLKPALVIILEALVVCGVLLYWGIRYEYPLWLALAGINLPLQGVRLRDIKRVISVEKISPYA